MELLLEMTARFRLDELLEESGLSQRELAVRSGVSPTTINRMANNLTAQVSLKTLDSLARALSASGRKVRPGDLIEEAPEKKRGRG
jgi:transcriptional regulator with XRE-family HTH domain